MKILKQDLVRIFMMCVLIFTFISCKKDRDVDPNPTPDISPCLKITHFNTIDQEIGLYGFKYDEQGNVLSHTSTLGKYKTISEFSNGNLIKKTINGILNLIVEIEYDNINRVKKEVFTHYDNNGNVIENHKSTSIYEYNSTNKKSKVSKYDANNRLFEYWIFEYSDLSEKHSNYTINLNNEVTLSAYIITNFNNQKKITTYEYYTKDLFSFSDIYLNEKINYEYNTDGNTKTMNSKYYDSTGSIIWENEFLYEYNENKQLKKEIVFSITNSVKTMSSYSIYEKKCE